MGRTLAAANVDATPRPELTPDAAAAVERAALSARRALEAIGRGRGGSPGRAGAVRIRPGRGNPQNPWVGERTRYGHSGEEATPRKIRGHGVGGRRQAARAVALPSETCGLPRRLLDGLPRRPAVSGERASSTTIPWSTPGGERLELPSTHRFPLPAAFLPGPSAAARRGDFGSSLAEDECRRACRAAREPSSTLASAAAVGEGPPVHVCSGGYFVGFEYWVVNGSVFPQGS